MRFAHLADCHIGNWREPRLNTISVRAFSKAIDLAIEKKVDFVLIAGDLFNNSLPNIDRLKETTIKLKLLKDNNIPVYLVPGSHDFSPSGKTMLDVLEHAGLCINVAKREDKDYQDGRLHLKFTVDKKTGAKITGMLGKKGSLEKTYLESLAREELEHEPGFKIFLFHSLLSEMKPKDMQMAESVAESLLPKNFDYYAGGHPHFVFKKQEKDLGLVAYPGPLFPNSFSEIEKLGNGGFYIYDDGKLRWEPIQIYNTFSLQQDCSNKAPEQVERELQERIASQEFINTIVTIRLSGMLLSGRIKDIDLKKITDICYDKGAYFVMKNTIGLKTKEFQEIRIEAKDTDDIEDKLIKEHLSQGIEKEAAVTKDLIKALSSFRNEGERVTDFEDKIITDAKKILNLKL